MLTTSPSRFHPVSPWILREEAYYFLEAAHDAVDTLSIMISLFHPLSQICFIFTSAPGFQPHENYK